MGDKDDEIAALTKAVQRSYTDLDKACKRPSLTRSRSFGCPAEPRTTVAKLKQGSMKKPFVAKRSSSISFNEEVTYNHVDSFKHELSKEEQDEIWYDDVEMVIMKVDCGLFSRAAKNQQKQHQEELEQQRRNKPTPE